MQTSAHMNTLQASKLIRSGGIWWDPQLPGNRLKDGRVVVVDDWLPEEGVFDASSPEGIASEGRRQIVAKNTVRIKEFERAMA